MGAPVETRGLPNAEQNIRRFRSRLVWTDLISVALAIGLGLLISSRASEWAINPLLAVYGTPAVIAALWIGFLTLRGTYDLRVIGLGPEEIRRVVTATLYTFAFVAGLSYLLRADISRAYAFVALPVGLILVVTSRFAWRKWLYAKRASGSYQFTTMVLGTGAASDELVEGLRNSYYAGYKVVHQYAGPSSSGSVDEWLIELMHFVDDKDIEAIAVAPSERTSASVIRQLAWNLEGRKIDLLISPGLLNIGGPRLTVRRSAGLPLLHLDEATLSRWQRTGKRALDLFGAVIFLIFLSPVMFVCAIAVKVGSRGPMFFRQERVGRAGEPFGMLKFRTMVPNADLLKYQLRQRHELDGPMFKLHNDPRITGAGKFLRRWSLDELPQLFNVLGGSMSLVGPRPHPLDDVHRYENAAYRRLALKPGLTGLWQVEGRSNLSWDDALELDLKYVEQWSLSGDLVLLARTLRAVLQGRGAY